MAKPSASTVDALWRRMLGMYGNTWASQFGEQPQGLTADTWASALAGLTTAQIAEGLRACVAEGSEFPPNAPRFRAMCLGIPSFAQVKLESTRSDADRSPFTRACWLHIDGYAYRQASAKDGERMLRDAYDLAREQVMRGVELPAPSLAIEHQPAPKPQLPQTPEERREHLARLLGGAYNPATADPDYDPHRVHRNRERAEAEAALASMNLPPLTVSPGPDEE